MCGEDSEDYSGGDIHGNGEYIKVRVEVKVERSGAPDLAPAGGEDLQAPSLVGRRGMMSLRMVSGRRLM